MFALIFEQAIIDLNISMLSVFRVCLGLPVKANTNSLKHAAFFRLNAISFILFISG